MYKIVHFVILLLLRMQVAIWRDLGRKRLVVAFRGTEQVGFLVVIIRRKSFEISSDTQSFSDKVEGSAHRFDACTYRVTQLYCVIIS